MSKTLKNHIAAFLIATAAGAALHFLYDALPNPLTAIIAPVNESVWEHIKLAYWPCLAAALILTYAGGAKDKTDYLAAHSAALLAIPAIIIVGYYFFTGALGIESLLFDIVLYILAMAAGFYVSYVLYTTGRAEGKLPALGFAAAVLGVLIVLFTFFPPELPMFIDSAGSAAWTTIPY